MVLEGHAFFFTRSAKPMSNYLSERADESNGDQSRSLKTNLAELIARGEASFPTGLKKHEKQKLLQAVQDYRRRRLVHYIAGAIAQDILRTRDNQQHGGL